MVVRNDMQLVSCTSLELSVAKCARLPFLVLVLVCAGSGARAQAETALAGTDAFVAQHAVPSRLADRSLMVAIARAGSRLVAVGERGRVVLSDDAGKTWRQSAGVPVSVTLTAVTFVDARNGWATGHAGVVLHTADAGETWIVQLDGDKAAHLALDATAGRPADDPALVTARQWVADGPDKPFLAVEFTTATSGLVVGAYGLVFATNDGGATWVSRLLDVDNPGGLHLNAIRTIGPDTFIAGEKGLLLRSDGKGRFVALPSPYDGSWFALEAMPGGGVVVAGLRGHAYASDDAGTTWKRLDVPSGATLSHASPVAGGTLLFVDQSGSVIAMGADRRLVPLKLPPTAPVTSIAQAADGSFVATTLRGPLPLTIDRAALNAASGAVR